MNNNRWEELTGANFTKLVSIPCSNLEVLFDNGDIVACGGSYPPDAIMTHFREKEKQL